MLFFNIAIGISMAIFLQKATDFGWILSLIFFVSYALSELYRMKLGMDFKKVLESGMSMDRIRTKVMVPASIASVLMWALITSVIYNLFN
jgi:hypothetical protein